MQRRKFLKKMLGASALVAAAPTMALAKKTDESCLSNGVVRGHSPKKEILYKMTKNWEIYYKNAI